MIFSSKTYGVRRLGCLVRQSLWAMVLVASSGTANLAYGRPGKEALPELLVTIDVGGARIESGFPAKLETFAREALDEAELTWRQSVAVADPWGWRPSRLSITLVKQPRGFELTLTAEAEVRYQDVVLDPGVTGQEELIELHHEGPVRDNHLAYFEEECANVVSAFGAPRGQYATSELSGPMREIRAWGTYWPFLYAFYTQKCAVRLGHLAECLDPSGHPKNCQYAQRIRHITMRQRIACVDAEGSYSCVQLGQDPYFQDQSANLLTLLNNDDDEVRYDD